MVTRTCETKRGVKVEIGSRRETVSDRPNPSWTGSADNQVPTKTADFALGARGNPWSRWALAAVGTVGSQLAAPRDGDGGYRHLLHGCYWVSRPRCGLTAGTAMGAY
jgi:hypothetical protein